MRRKIAFLLFFFFFLVANHEVVSAQDKSCDICKALLVPDKTEINSQSTTFLAWISIIDEKTFNKVIRDRSGSISVPIEGIPVGAQGSYRNFDEWRREYLNSRNYRLSEEKSYSYLKEALPKHTTDAFINCLERCSKPNGSGLFLRIAETGCDESVVSGTIYFSPFPGGPNKIKISTFSPTSRKVEILVNPTGEVVAGGGGANFQIDRKSFSGKFSIQVQTDIGLPASVEVQCCPPPTPNEVKIEGCSFAEQSNLICALNNGQYGDDTVTDNNPDGRLGDGDLRRVVYYFQTDEDGESEVFATYAKDDPASIRSPDLAIDGYTVGYLRETTGGWFPPQRRTVRIGTIVLRKGQHSLVISSKMAFPCLKSVSLKPNPRKC